MAFPETRLTVMQRLAAGGSTKDWQQFLADYWGPVFRFCLRRGAANVTIAEDVTSEVFEVLWRKNLLKRWQENRAAKLRTLICTVARNLLSQRYRSQKTSLPIDDDVSEQSLDVDIFYAAWAEDILRRSLDSLAVAYRREGKGDYLRVFLGRTCEALTIREVASAMGLPDSAVDHHYRHVRNALQNELKSLVRVQVSQYCPAADQEDEFGQEWQKLAQFLHQQGDLDRLLQESFAEQSAGNEAISRQQGISKMVARLSSIRPSNPDANI